MSRFIRFLCASLNFVSINRLWKSLRNCPMKSSSDCLKLIVYKHTSFCFLFFSLHFTLLCFWASLVAYMVKKSICQVQTLSWEDPLKKGMATHSSILAWRIPWTEESGELQSMGSQRVSHIWETNTLIMLHRFFFFNKLKVCGNPEWGKSISAIFPTVFAQFLSLCHILVIIAIFQASPFLLYDIFYL